MLPLVLLCACVSPMQIPTKDQPELAQLAQPYMPQLQAVGITRVISPGKGALVRLDTGYGSIYMPYPARADPVAFELDVGADGLRASGPTFDPVKDREVLAWLLPEAVRLTAAHNEIGWLLANPWQ